jgi:hypothetical protein
MWFGKPENRGFFKRKSGKQAKKLKIAFWVRRAMRTWFSTMPDDVVQSVLQNLFLRIFGAELPDFGGTPFKSKPGS